MKKVGFDNELYMKLTLEEIISRKEKFNNKIYLEIGGKLFDDFHASRVLPGFKYNSKINVLKSLASQTEVILCISAKDIERHKQREDYNISYETDIFRLIDKIRENELLVTGVVITQYESQSSSDELIQKLNINGIKTFKHYFTKGYPTDIDAVVSEEGYGKNDYIETTKPIVVVTAPGPGSGKLATCLSQLYHEQKKGIVSGYAKFETFPVWDLPLNHPVNYAYEAATADLKDVNMIDPYYMQEYNKVAVNYNRDIEVFPVLKVILRAILKDDIYSSPTDMGINCVGKAITNDEVVRIASKNEIIRRYYKSLVECKEGKCSKDAAERIKVIMNNLEIDVNSRKVVLEANKKKEKRGTHSMAIELESGKVIAGRTTDLMTAPAACVLNALKYLSKLDEDVHIISPLVLEPMIKLKKRLYNGNVCLNLNEILLSLSINAATNPIIDNLLNKLDNLRDCEAHATYILSSSDSSLLKRIGVNYTTDAVYPTDNLYNE
ncbi:MAG: DUF1846 family protein [Bacilli bacterium]